MSIGEWLDPWARNTYHAANAEETSAAMQAAYLRELMHRQAAEDASRRLEAQNLRMPTLEDIRIPCAERTYEGRPLLSYDADFLRSLGIKP